MIGRTVYDISVALGRESIDYPGDPPYSRQWVARLSGGDGCDLSRIEMSAHAGTHIDAPAHFIPQGKTIDQYAAGDFIRTAHVVDIADPLAIRAEAIAAVNSRPGDALLFRTANSTSGRIVSGAFSEAFVYLTPEAADACVARRVGLVGIDFITIDRYGDPAFPVHRILLGAGIFILEGINLAHVPAGVYTLVCLPLRIAAAEASPVRAVLIG